GLVIALLPTWGDKLNKSTWGEGPEIFTVQNARVYGKWIGNRYKRFGYFVVSVDSAIWNE
ncbi:MAG: DUF4038 domain-containing protein, partial [Sediminibacterium sp.]